MTQISDKVITVLEFDADKHRKLDIIFYHSNQCQILVQPLRAGKKCTLLVIYEALNLLNKIYMECNRMF